MLWKYSKIYQFHIFTLPFLMDSLGSIAGGWWRSRFLSVKCSIYKTCFGEKRQVAAAFGVMVYFEQIFLEICTSIQRNMQTIFRTFFTFNLGLFVKTTPKGELPCSFILFLLGRFPALPLKTTKPIYSNIPQTLLLPFLPFLPPHLLNPPPSPLLLLLHFLLQSHLSHNLLILQMQFSRLCILKFAVIVVHYRLIISWDFHKRFSCVEIVVDSEHRQLFIYFFHFIYEWEFLFYLIIAITSYRHI